MTRTPSARSTASNGPESALHAGYWASISYLAAIAPILCWELDELAGMGDRRVRLPADPVGRVEGWLDRRWPIRPAAMR